MARIPRDPPPPPPFKLPDDLAWELDNLDAILPDECPVLLTAPNLRRSRCFKKCRCGWRREPLNGSVQFVRPKSILAPWKRLFRARTPPAGDDSE